MWEQKRLPGMHVLEAHSWREHRPGQQSWELRMLMWLPDRCHHAPRCHMFPTRRPRVSLWLPSAWLLLRELELCFWDQ